MIVYVDAGWEEIRNQLQANLGSWFFVKYTFAVKTQQLKRERERESAELSFMQLFSFNNRHSLTSFLMQL